MKDDNKGVRAGDIIYHLLKGWRVILSFTIIGFIVGVMIFGIGYIRGEMAQEYKVTSSVAVVAQNADGTFASRYNNPNEQDVNVAEDITEAAMYIIKSESTLNSVIEKLGLHGVTASDISRNLTLKRYKETQIIELSLFWRSKSEGEHIMSDIIKESDDRMLTTLMIGKINTINEPKGTFVIGGFVRMKTWFYAALVGFVLGIAWCILKYLMVPTIINNKEIEKMYGMEVLGEIPLNRMFGAGNPLDEKSTPSSDAVDSISHILLNRLERAEVNKVYITSTEHEEGNTRVIADIAKKVADTGKKTLLIDCNFKHPSLGVLFREKIEYDKTINALYNGDADKFDAVIHITGCLDLLPAMLDDQPLRLNDAMLEVIRDAMDGYDYVFIDAAPIGVDTEVVNLNKITDTALMIVGFDMAYQDDINTAVSRIADSGIPVIGCVVNATKNWRSIMKETRKSQKRFSDKKGKEFKKRGENNP